MSKADSDSIRKPTPVTVTVAEITSLCDRLAARAKKRLARGSTGASARPRSCGPRNPAHRTCRLGEDVGRGRLRTAHRCEVLPGRRMRAGPFLLFASREQRKVQKYENGTDRVSASWLYLIAEALGVGIGFFYGRRRRRCRHRHRGRRGLDRIAWASGTRSRSSNASAT